MSQYAAQWMDGISVRWRTLSLTEYRKFRQRVAAADSGTICALYEACVLEGPPTSQVPFGVAQFVAEHVLKEDPYGGDYLTVSRVLEATRQEVNGSYINQARALIVRAFHYKLEDIDKWDSGTFFERLAMAELITEVRLNPVNPKEIIEKADKPPSPRRQLNPTQAKAAERVRIRDRNR